MQIKGTLVGQRRSLRREQTQMSGFGTGVVRVPFKPNLLQGNKAAQNQNHSLESDLES